jgi:hypothetical protein
MADIARIKRNIQRMIDQNAPETDIDAYVSGEGVSLDDLKAPQTDPTMGFGERSQRETIAPETPDLRRHIDAAKAEAGFNALPWYGKAAQAADDIVRQTANGMTFGYADKLAGYMNGTGVEAERAKSQEAHDRSGLAGDAAEIAGNFATANPLLKAGGAVASAIPGVGALSGASGALGYGARLAGAGAGGAGLGALSAAGHDQDIGEGAAFGAAAGAAGKVAGDVIGGTVDKLAGAFNKKPILPSTEKIRQMAQDAYDRSEKAGVIVKADRLAQLRDDIVGKLADEGYHPELHGRVATVLKELDRLSGENATLKGVDVLRKIANNARMSQDPSEGRLGTKIIQKIDDMVANLNPKDAIGGDVREGAKALVDARKLWAQNKKADLIEVAVEKATRRAASTGSGGNVDNAMRQNIRRILEKNPGFSKDEKAALEAIIRGTPVQNAMRLLGKLSPQGNGLMMMLHGVGGYASGGATLPMAVVGAGAKAVADSATPRNVEQALRVVRAGGDASATRAAPNALQRLSRSERETLSKLLTLGGIDLSASVQPQQP